MTATRVVPTRTAPRATATGASAPAPARAPATDRPHTYPGAAPRGHRGGTEGTQGRDRGDILRGPREGPLVTSGERLELDRTDLPSGLSVVSERLDDVRSVAIGFWIRVGSRDEEGADQGASHFLEHLLFKGTERRSAREIAEALDAVGGDLNAFTSKEYTCFYARVLDKDVQVAVDVLADMVRSATITPEDVEQERQVVLEEINIHLDTPEDLAHSDFAEVILRGHPLSLEVLGSPDSIGSMTRDRVNGYYERYYRPNNITVAAAGHLDHDQLVQLVAEHAGDLGRPEGEGPARKAPERYGANDVSIRHRPTEQAHVVLGTPGLARDDDRRFSMLVMNALLGGGMSARLFQEVREQRGLAYSTYSYHSSYADGGYFGAYAGTTPAKVDELAKVLRDELDRLPTSIEPAEVDRAKGNLKGSIVLGSEDTGSRMTRLGKMICTDSEVIDIDEAIARIEGVTIDDVRAIADEVIGQPRCMSVVGPFDEDAPERFADYIT
ncbi:MAG: insulinase family protein [Actinobacteria bacterium]|nr:insulinase family protein [Actinomycetota bacterium]